MNRILIALALCWGVAPHLAKAEPVLQLYVEGASYDDGTESWTIDSDSFTLWVIGNTGWKGTIEDVKLAFAYDSSETLGISITPSTTGGLGGFTDPSTPVAPTFIQTVTDGSSPKLGDGSDLPSHGIYGAGTAWTEFLLGDFTLTDSPIADFIDSFPSPNKDDAAQINVYDVTVSGVSGLHIDTYNHVAGSNHTWYKFAPFSHDADGGGETPVPEPGTLALLGAALGCGWFVRRRRSA